MKRKPFILYCFGYFRFSVNRSVPVGHNWKFDLEERENTWFSNEVLFFKNSNGACHAQFSRDN